jgi:hypothetical protein
MDPQLHSREQISEYGMETYKITTQKDVQISIISAKIMMTLFWDAQGQILEHYHDSGTRVKCASEMLRDLLKPAIRTKH